MTEWSEQFWRWISYFHVTESINFAHNHMSGKIIGNKFNLAHYAAISLTHIYYKAIDRFYSGNGLLQFKADVCCRTLAAEEKQTIRNAHKRFLVRRGQENLSKLNQTFISNCERSQHFGTFDSMTHKVQKKKKFDFTPNMEPLSCYTWMSLTNDIVNVEQLVISIAKHTSHSVDDRSSSFHWQEETQKMKETEMKNKHK